MRDETRQFCTRTDPVWGGMAAAIRPPFTLHWFERYPSQLYDLTGKPRQKGQPLSDEARRALEALGYIER